MILLLCLAAISIALAVSIVTACAVAVRAITAPRRAVAGDPPAGLGAGTISFASGTGLQLAAWFAPGRPGGGGVLLVHGIGSDRRILASRIAFLARGGLAVLALDLRGHGESAPARVTFGRDEAHDVAAALDWLRAAAPGEKVGALGLSLGGAAVALASRTCPIDAMVLEAVFPDIRSAVANRVRRIAGAAAVVLAPLLLAVGTGVTGLRPSELRPIDAVARYAGPLFVISGDEDRSTPIAEARALFDAAPGAQEFWAVRGAGHVDMAAAAGIDYEKRILAFFGRHLQRDAPCA